MSKCQEAIADSHALKVGKMTGCMHCITGKSLHWRVLNGTMKQAESAPAGLSKDRFMFTVHAAVRSSALPRQEACARLSNILSSGDSCKEHPLPSAATRHGAWDEAAAHLQRLLLKVLEEGALEVGLQAIAIEPEQALFAILVASSCVLCSIAPELAVHAWRGAVPQIV